ncbi:hypothetical protein Tco_1107758 [Tanacetum coccineum]
MNSSLVAPSLTSRYLSTRATDAKSGSTDLRFIALVVGGDVDVDYCGRGVKDGSDCRMTVEYTGEESVITETCTVRSVSVCGFSGTSDGHENIH